MTQIICLANSTKISGRCIAGIDVQTGKWVRPVSLVGGRASAVTGTIRRIKGQEPKLLDVLEISLKNDGPDEGCQPENRALSPGTWKKIGEVTKEDVLKYCENDGYILHNGNHRVLFNRFEDIPREQWKSLQLVHGKNIKFRSELNQYNKKRWKALFIDDRDNFLDLPITDPIASGKLDNKQKLSKNCLLTISLGGPYSSGIGRPKYCYKLVAGVIEL